ncbi:MAG: GlsB/YeaQ/YmgE family stress response membrane protein [Solirubrobacterales bacterium]|nr:GlsB/YeaQ/YmgE family stress response membrane protein [Solirubrobacterales bacterium]
MSTLGFIIALLFTGLIVGALARLLLPGRDPMSIFQTILIGIAGSLVAGLIAYYAFDKQEGPGFLLSIICTVGLVYAVRKMRENKTPRG